MDYSRSSVSDYYYAGVCITKPGAPITDLSDELIKFEAEKLGAKYQNEFVQIDARKWEWRKLDSWDLFGRGLEACPYTVKIEYTGQHTLTMVQVGQKRRNFEELADLPLSFWKAWYRLEQQTKEELT